MGWGAQDRDTHALMPVPRAPAPSVTDADEAANGGVCEVGDVRAMPLVGRDPALTGGVAMNPTSAVLRIHIADADAVSVEDERCVCRCGRRLGCERATQHRGD